MRELAPGTALLRDAIGAINQLIRGRGNAVLQVTLSSGATSTTVQNANINADSKPQLSAASASAASGITSTYVQVTSAGVAVIYHPISAATDRKINLHFIGG